MNCSLYLCVVVRTINSIIRYFIPGLSQLPLLLLLVKLYKADINLFNIDGLTCLMLAASRGDGLLVDVSFSAVSVLFMERSEGQLAVGSFGR
jgi:hypothetical protein